jgi:site-specific DNA recombinase
MKAAVYSRFSTDRQNESSIGDQVRVCTEHAQKQGWQVTQYFEDQGISGAALGNRPGILALQEVALTRRFDVLLVTELSRLSRSQGDLSKMIARLVAKGIRIVGVLDGYDSARRGHKMQAGLSGIIGDAFREMVKDRTYAALESRAKQGKATGGRAYGYREGLVDKGEAFIVREIFGKFASGQSAGAIASDLNARRIPSPGSSWRRTQRRATGWMGSGVRVILRNERYRGVIHWNVSEFRKDPDTGKRLRIERPRSEWIRRADESQRIVEDSLWEQAQKRMKRTAEHGHWATPRGKAKYLLSGLLRCASCGAHYIICNAHEYACSSYVNGRACDNHVRVRRLSLEEDILGPIRRQLLAPDRVERMAREMHGEFQGEVRSIQTRAAAVPKELQDLNARIERLRERLMTGDPDMPADEIQAAIDGAEAKRRDLSMRQPAAKQSSRVLSILPRAAEEFRRQVAQGLDGDEHSALKARMVLREMFGGRVELSREGEELWAEYGLQPAAVLSLGIMVAGAGFEPATFGL